MEKKVGSIVLATDQGLGYLAKDFFDNGIINKVLIHEHSSRKNHRDWYPREAVVSSREELLECDSLIFFEEVWDWKIIPEARKKGIRTTLIPMYECTRSPLPYYPDQIIVPSLLDKEYYPDSVFVPIPVNVPWTLKKDAGIFVHNAGNGGLGGRNGTKELIEALPLIKSTIRLIIRSQVPLPEIKDERVTVIIGTVPNNQLYEEGDVFIFPEKFNGLSLPLQEAFASGMVVMCGDRFPMNTWLPREPLIPVSGYKRERISVEFNSAVISPKDIANTIDSWYCKDITELSLQGKEWAQKNSWEVLGPVYKKLIYGD